MSARRAVLNLPTLAFLAILAVLIGLRIAVLRASPLDLHFDEAQYWTWSRTLEWGYFSKPPLVAWAIAASTALFGDAEWAVRLAAPVAHGLGAIALFALGRGIYGAWAGFWAGTGWLLLPAVSLSSGIISTDALMLPLWSAALWALWRLTLTRAWFWAIVLGLVVGAGALAKYSMLYFPLCAALAAWWSMPVRAAILSRLGVIAGLVALAVLTPHLIWNARNAFITVAHTAANARLNQDDLINPDEVFEFVSGQAGVIGPLLLLALIWLLWRAARRTASLADEDKFLLAFALPPLAAILAQAFFARANANWAAAAYPAALVWIAGSLLTSARGRRYLAAASLVNLALGAAITVAAVSPAFANRFEFIANGMKRARGWEETAREIALRAAPKPGEAPFTAVLVDHRALYFELAYYWREQRAAGQATPTRLRRSEAPASPRRERSFSFAQASAQLPPVRMWLLHGQARNSAEQSDPMRLEEGARVLVVHMTPGYVPLVADDFTAFRRVERLAIPLGGGLNRELEISVGEDFAPAPRDAAFERGLRGE